MSWEVAVFIVAIVLSGAFSATEAAFLSVRRSWVRQRVHAGAPGAARLAAYAEHPGRLLPVVLIGNNIVNTLAATIGALLVGDLLPTEGLTALVTTAGVAAILILFGESVPKMLGATFANRLAALLAFPVQVAEVVLLPLAFPLRLLNAGLLRLLKPTRHHELVEEEIKLLVALGRETGNLEETEAELLLQTLRVFDLRLNDVMTPWARVRSAAADLSARDFLLLNQSLSFTRVPVLKGEEVVGVLVIGELIRMTEADSAQLDAPVSAFCGPALALDEGLPITDVLRAIRESQQRMAIVVDASGAPVGLVTANQILGGILGMPEDPRAEQVGA